MIKATVMYSAVDTAYFNMEYYLQTHIPLVKRLLKPLLKRVEIEQGINSVAPGSAPLYIIIGHLFFERMEDFETLMSVHGEEIMGDIARFTNTQPILQLSEVIL